MSTHQHLHDTEQTSSADQDHVTELKATAKASEWFLSWDCFVETQAM